MSGCHSVPFEGSTLQCDARTNPHCDAGPEGRSEAAEGVDSLSFLFAFASSVARSERLLQRQRSLFLDSASFATFA